MTGITTFCSRGCCNAIPLKSLLLGTLYPLTACQQDIHTLATTVANCRNSDVGHGFAGSSNTNRSSSSLGPPLAATTASQLYQLLLLQLLLRFKLPALLSLWSAPTASDTLLKPSRSRHSANCCLIVGMRAGPSYAKAVYNSTRLAPARIFLYASSPAGNSNKMTAGALMDQLCCAVLCCADHWTRGRRFTLHKLLQ